MTKLLHPKSGKLIAPKGTQGKVVCTQYGKVFPSKERKAGHYWDPVTDTIHPIPTYDMMALSVPRADVWAQKDYLQIVSIDPAVVNLALRIERRYTNRPPEVVHFDKVTLTDDPEVPLALALHTWLMTLD